MRRHFVGTVQRVVAVAALVGLVPVVVTAQEAAWGAAAAPRQGEAARPAPPPRTPDGQPNLQGHWGTRGAPMATYDLEGGSDAAHAIITGGTPQGSPRVIVDPPDGKIPYTRAGAAKRKEHLEHHANPRGPQDIDPQSLCLLSGVPHMNYQGGLQIVQTPGYVLFAHEFNHAYRIIPLDARPHLAGNVKLWMGDSRGRWEGNTLVVDVTNLDGRPWLDIAGNHHSDAMHLVERWTWVDADTIGYEVTIEDPKAFSRHWKMKFTYARNMDKSYEQMEVACIEGLRSEFYFSRQPTK